MPNRTQRFAKLVKLGNGADEQRRGLSGAFMGCNPTPTI